MPGGHGFGNADRCHRECGTTEQFGQGVKGLLISDHNQIYVSEDIHSIVTEPETCHEFGGQSAAIGSETDDDELKHSIPSSDSTS
jgi:hypothetical protein